MNNKESPFVASGIVLPGEHEHLTVREPVPGLYVVDNAYQVDMGYFGKSPDYGGVDMAKKKISEQQMSFSDFKKGILAVLDIVDYDIAKDYDPRLSDEDEAEMDDDYREMASAFTKASGIKVVE